MLALPYGHDHGTRRYADRTEYKPWSSAEQAQKSPWPRLSRSLFTAYASMGNKFPRSACELQLAPSAANSLQIRMADALGSGQTGLPPTAPGI